MGIINKKLNSRELMRRLNNNPDSYILKRYQSATAYTHDDEELGDISERTFMNLINKNKTDYITTIKGLVNGDIYRPRTEK